jgi:hypothetical protein
VRSSRLSAEPEQQFDFARRQRAASQTYGDFTGLEKLAVEQAAPGEQTSSVITDSLYESYQPRRLKIAGAHAHPSPLVESAAMASVEPPAAS